MSGYYVEGRDGYSWRSAHAATEEEAAALADQWEHDGWAITVTAPEPETGQLTLEGDTE